MGTMGSRPLVIDGSHGEGGGQILRTAMSLAAIAGRRLRVVNIRKGRPKPGLAAQHLTAIRAAAAITGGNLEGDRLGSETLEYVPGGSPVPGDYHFDVTEAREGGSAGAATLVLQTAALPLVLSGGKSIVTVKGGTHVPWSPSFDFLEQIWLPALRRMGISAEARLGGWGFYPAGGGEITLELSGTQGGSSTPLSPLTATDRGMLTGIDGRAVAANLPSHIAQRMADRAEALLRPLGVPIAVKAERVTAVSPGAWIFLRAVYEGGQAGFGALGKRGKPAEVVAEEAIAELANHHDSGAILDRHMADQILLPLAFAAGPSELSCAAVTPHLQTNAWVIEQFGVAGIGIESRPDGAGLVRVYPAGKFPTPSAA